MKELPPIPETYSATIATRYLELKHQGGIEKVTVEIGLPLNDVETVTGFDWRCPIKITIGETPTDKIYQVISAYACGVDSFQALELATNTLVEAKLTDIAKEYQATLSLCDDSSI